MLDAKKAELLKQHIAHLKIGFAGNFFYYCLPIRKQVVLSNMHQAFSTVLTRQEIKKLAKAFYQHMAMFLFENLQLRFLTQQQIQSRVEVKGHEYLLKAREKGKGIALLAGHFGNWELGAIGGMLNFQSFRGHFYVIRKTLNYKCLEKLLFRRFFSAGILVIPKTNALSYAVEALENKNAVVFIMDQYASIKAKDGIAVPFFGKQTGTYKSLAMIAQNTDAEVIPMKCYRDEKKKHVLEFYPPISISSEENNKKALYLNTKHYNESLEKMILSHPEQWLWLHKRWKEA
jgi:Kdo2-lipid IVA lauroyltransferase/acyltransferase